MDLLADSDGALQTLYGDLTGEEALDDLDDEEGVLLVELPGGDDGLTEGKAFDPYWGLNRSEAEAILFGSVGAVGKFRCDLKRKGLGGSVRSRTLDDEGSRLSRPILQVT